MSDRLYSNTMEITQKRFVRLRECRCVLGEPDVLVIHEIKCSSSFFGKEKRLEDHQEYFITGLVFPTTAHFSTFISSKIKTEVKSLVKASLLVFDAFQKRDIHIDINIPGSMEIKAYTLKGEETTYSSQDYDYSYNSSVLRSLRIMDYPNIVAYPFVHRLEFLRVFMKGFIRFNFEHELRAMDYDELDKEMWIDILLNYCLDNQSNVLLQEIIQEVKKYSVAKANEYELKFKLHAQLQREIIVKTAEKLLLHPNISLLKEFQIEALFKERKFKEVVQVGRNLFHSSMSNYATYARVVEAYSELNMDRQFLSCMNLVTNLCGEEKQLRQVTHMKSSSMENVGHTNTGGSSLSTHPELLFQFGNNFLNQEYENYKEMLKNSSKEGITFNVVSKLEATLDHFPKFYRLLVKFEKRKSWKELVKCRAECFWLQKDFIDYEDKMQSKTNFELGSFINIGEEERSQRVGAEERGVESFDGGLSEHEDEQEMVDLPPCSRRIDPLKKRFLSENKKIICNMNLERLFLLLAEDIKLQNAMEKWELRMKNYQEKSLSPEKKELIAIIFLKKAFLHRKLMRNKKCEQSFKISRKLSVSPQINIIACYQLILLYMETNIVKGVEFYLIELVNIISKMGVATFDIVPEWARPILSYLLKHEGIGAVKRANGNLKSLLALFLRGNYTVEFIEELIKEQGKKDRVELNKT